MIRHLRQRWHRLSRDQRGQALVEYTFIVAVLVAALAVPFPSGLPPPLGGRTFMGAMLDAYRAYYVSYYYVLNLPFP